MCGHVLPLKLIPALVLTEDRLPPTAPVMILELLSRKDLAAVLASGSAEIAGELEMVLEEEARDESTAGRGT